MRLAVGLLTFALLMAWNPVTPAQAQCTMYCPNGAAKGKSAKAKPAKKVAGKKQKKPTKEQYMRVAP